MNEKEQADQQPAPKPILEIDSNVIRQRKFMVCTPMYGGMCSGYYMNSMMGLKEICTLNGIKFDHFSLYTESLITRARNYCADHFLKSDCTHLVFIDSDIHFNPVDVLALVQIADPLTEYDVVCGPYAKKQIVWPNVAAAVNQGFADKDPYSLESIVGSLVFSPVKDGEYAINQPMEVRESGTGFMCIQRHVLERFAKARTDLSYYPDHVDTKEFGGDRTITGFFMDPLVEDQGKMRHLSEDYFFCHEVRKLGMHVYICPWMQMGHIGHFEYRSNIQMMANLKLPVINLKKR